MTAVEVGDREIVVRRSDDNRDYVDTWQFKVGVFGKNKGEGGGDKVKVIAGGAPITFVKNKAEEEKAVEGLEVVTGTKKTTSKRTKKTTKTKKATTQRAKKTSRKSR